MRLAKYFSLARTFVAWATAVILVASAVPSSAVTYTWIGANNATWSTTGTTNWTPTGAPVGGGTDSVVFASGTGGTNVNVSSAQYALTTVINRDTTFLGAGTTVATGTSLTIADNLNVSFQNWRLTSSSGTASNSIGSGATVTVNGTASMATSASVKLNANSLLSFKNSVNLNYNAAFGGSGTVAWAATSGSNGGNNGFRFNLSDTVTFRINSDAAATTGTAQANIIVSSGTNTVLLQRDFDFMTPSTTGTAGILGLGYARTIASPGNPSQQNASMTISGPYTLSANLLGVTFLSGTQKLVINTGTVQIGDFSAGKAQGVYTTNGSSGGSILYGVANSNTSTLEIGGPASAGTLRVNANSSFNATTDASGSNSLGYQVSVTGTSTLVNNGAWTNRNFKDATILTGLNIGSTATLSGTGSFDLRTGYTGAGATGIGKAVVISGIVAPGDVVNGVNGVGTLTINSGTVSFGAASKVAISGSGATLDQLVLNAPVSVTSGAAIDFAGASSLTQGRYQVVTGSSGVNTFTASNAPAAYTFGTSGTDAYLWAKPVFGTISTTPAAPQVITGGTVAFTYAVQNAASSGGQNLAFTSAAGSGIVGTVSGTTTVAPLATSGSISGFSFVASTAGPGRTATFTVSDPNAVTTTATGTVSLDVYDHASGSATGATIALPDSIVGYSGPLSGLTSATISNAAGYRVNLMTTGGTSAGFVNINNVSGIASGSSALISAAASLNGTQTVGANSLGQVFNLTYADNSALAGAANSLGSQSITVTGNVLDHALPAFATAAGSAVLDPLTTGTIELDFGSIDLTLGTQSLTYSLTNLASLAGPTAGLALTAFTSDGDGFSSGLASFADLVAGGTSSLFTAQFAPTTEGSFSRSYTLSFYDNQSVAGSTQRRDLTVNMQAVVVPEPGALAIAGAGVILVGWRLARRRVS